MNTGDPGEEGTFPHVGVAHEKHFFPAVSLMAPGSSAGRREGNDKHGGRNLPPDGDLPAVKLEGHRTVKGHSGHFLHHLADPEAQGFKTFGAAVLCRHLRYAAEGAVGRSLRATAGPPDDGEGSIRRFPPSKLAAGRIDIRSLFRRISFSIPSWVRTAAKALILSGVDRWYTSFTGCMG